MASQFPHLVKIYVWKICMQRSWCFSANRSTRNIVITSDLNAESLNFDFWVTLAENETEWKQIAPQWGFNSKHTVIKSSLTSFGRIILRSKTHRVISLSWTSARVSLAPFGLAKGYRVSDLESVSLIPTKKKRKEFWLQISKFLSCAAANWNLSHYASLLHISDSRVWGNAS